MLFVSIASVLKSFLDDVGEANLVVDEETVNGLSLSEAEGVLLGGRQLSPLVNRSGLVALGQSVVSLDESLESSLHFVF